MNVKINLNFFVELFIVLFMPLSVYSIVTNSMSFGDAILVFLLILIILHLLKRKVVLKDIINVDLFFYFLIVITNSFTMSIMNTNSFYDGVFGFLRYSAYLLFVLFAPKFFVNKDRFYEIYRKLGIIFAIYSISQFVFYYCFNKILPITIPSLPTMQDFNYIYSMQRFSKGIMFRPYSCFQEPSYYSIFISFLFFKYLNFNTFKTNKDYIYIIILGFSMLISGTTGIFTFLIAVVYKVFVNKTRTIKNTIPIILLIIPLIFFMLKSNYGNMLLSKIFVYENDSVVLGYSTYGRINNYMDVFKKMDGISLLIGKGMWFETEYLPSFGRMIVSFGIMGTILVFVLLHNLSKKLTKEGRCYFRIFIISLFVTNSLFTISSVFIFSLLMINLKDKVQNNIISEDDI